MKHLRTTAAGLSVAALVAASFATASAQPAPTSTPTSEGTVDLKIVGGKVTNQDWPWTAYVGGCGGTLIAKRWVVTAAHCLKFSPYKIRLDSRNRWEGGENIRPANIYKHPSYGERAGFDIGLVELSETPRTDPIRMAYPGSVGTPTKLLGWGQTHPTQGGGSTLLKELDTSIIRASECNGVAGEFNTRTEICTDNPGGNEGACFGDSGGPQIQRVNGRWVLIGATSRGPEVCTTEPSIYSAVAAHYDWFNEVSGGAIPAPLGRPGGGGGGGGGGTTTTTTAPPTTTTTAPIPGDDTFFNDNSQDIRDYRTATSSVDSTFAGASNVKISIDINHSCSENLELAITTPDGTRNVVKRAGYSWRCTAWRGEKSQSYPLRSESRGTWTLEAVDNRRGNEGTLNRWGIVLSK